MGINYTLGGGQGPRKPKKTKGPITPEEAGEESKKKRAARYNNASDKKKVSTALNVNNKTKEQVEDGLQMNEYGAPAGGQKFKKFMSLIRGQKSKF